MSEEIKKGLEAIIAEVEAAKAVDVTLTGLCSSGELGSPARHLLENTLSTIKSVANNLIKALPSNRRIVCLRLQRAGKLTSSKRNAQNAYISSAIKKCRVQNHQSETVIKEPQPQLRKQPTRQVHNNVCIVDIHVFCICNKFIT